MINNTKIIESNNGKETKPIDKNKKSLKTGVL